jgi:hypothetical protein
MANKKITQLPTAVNPMQATDLMEASIDNGGGIFTSEKFTGQQVSDGVIGIISNYAVVGSAYSQQPQFFAPNTPTAVMTEFPLIENNCLLGGGHDTGFIVDQTVCINILFEASVFNNGGTVDEISFHLQLNGSTVADSARYFISPPTNETLAFSANWILNVSTTDLIEVMITVSKASYELLYESNFTGIGSPSGKLNIFNIG